MNDSTDHATAEKPDRQSRCPACESDKVETSVAEHTFSYGQPPDAVELTAVLNVHSCLNCGLQFLDDQAEEEKHRAICAHLGVMSPEEIRALRERCGLSRADFAKLTRLGEATVARWERGALIQNAGYDQFLYLLNFPENMQRLRDRVCNHAVMPHHS